MALTEDKFEQSKMDRLKHFIQSHAEKGNPKFYEIFVDNLKVVDKTDKAEDFENYEDYISEDTDHIRVVIYYSAKSPRNEQYKYILKEKVIVLPPKKESELNGVEILGRMEEKLKIERERWDADLLKKENLELKVKLKESEDYSDILMEKYENLKLQKSSVTQNWGEFGSVLLEGFVRRNPQFLGKIIPGGEALAGLLEQDTKEQQERMKLQTTNDSEVTFSKRESVSPALTKEEQEFLQILKQLQGTFDENEIAAVMQILDRLASDTSKVHVVLELLTEPKAKEKIKENDLENTFKNFDNEEV